MTTLFRTLLLAAALLPVSPAVRAADCRSGAADGCFLALQPTQAQGTLHYYASLAAGQGDPVSALIALHGHSHDANKTFDAALRAVRGGDALDRTLVVAPLFQVDPDRAAKCRTAGVPAAQPGDLLWSCSSWMDGGRAEGGGGLGAFAAMDALVAEVHRQWPSVKTVTIAGFSAGAQMVQHYIGFAQAAPTGVALRYVVSDPGTWLYFDPDRPDASAAIGCDNTNRWKYGTEGLPALFGRDAAQARAQYASAQVHYLEGALDTGTGRGTAARVLDRSCAANAQGPYRLERGLAYATYDRARLAPLSQRQVTVVPGCAHDVACVFPSEAARAALLGKP
jgi:hypothetical protein